MSGRRLALALGGSVLLHAALLVALWRAPSPAAPPARALPLQVELFEPPTPQRPAPRSPPPALPLHRTPRPVGSGSPPVAVGRAASQPEPPATESAPVTSDAPEAKTPDLRPKLGAFQGTAEASGGRTEVPRPRDARKDAVEAAKHASARIQLFMDDDIAMARAQKGLISSYFDDVKRALQRGLARRGVPGESVFDAGVPVDLRTDVVEMEPHPGAPTADEVQVEERGDLNTEALKRDPAGLTTSGLIGQALGNSAGLRRLGMRALEVDKLRVLVEVRQRRDGTLLRMRLRKSSGHPAYDAEVLARLPEVLARMPAPPADAVGGPETGLRTVWEFARRRGLVSGADDVRLVAVDTPPK